MSDDQELDELALQALERVSETTLRLVGEIKVLRERVLALERRMAALEEPRGPS